MSVRNPPQRNVPATAAITTAAEPSHHGGGLAATILSGIALLISALSYYESALKAAELDVFVPPVIQYGRDGDSEVFAVPITISNGGSSTGTVLAMELTGEALKQAADLDTTKVYYSAFTGEHPRDAAVAHRSFAPISVPGRASFTETVRFYPQGKILPRLVQQEGEFRFTLKLKIAATQQPSWLERMLTPKPPAPVMFTRVLPYLSHQHLEFRRGTISMHAPDWQPSATSPRN